MIFAKMLCSTPKCMQQIAILIITFAVYVAGIRNAGNTVRADTKIHTTTTQAASSSDGANMGAIADYESYSAPYNEDFRPSQLLSEATEVISTAQFNNLERRQSTAENSGDFRPSQIISFTPSDAQSTPKQYPPSYQEPNYHPQHISKGGPYGLVSYTTNDNDKQFAFPRETEQTSAASASLDNLNTNLEKYLYTSAPSQQPTTTQQSLVPAQLHTTPILIYRDPYTNKLNKSQRQQQQHQQQHRQDYRPAPPPEPIYQQAQYAEAGRPQEYTVQSMLVVGAQHPTPPPPYAYNQQRPQFALHGGANRRPGYVFDEHVNPSYNRPVYSGHRYELGASAAPTPHSIDYNRRDGDTQTERPYEGKLGVSPSTPAKISYDSHDYPPPSYYQQQTSNFQSPQRQDSKPNYHHQKQQQQQQSIYVSPPAVTSGTTTVIKTGRPELTSSNYANKFGNYLQGGGGKIGDTGYYKRPPPHYSNDILYVTPAPPTAPERPQAPIRPAAPYYTQANEPLRRPLTPHSDYNQYQLGEIPPPQTLQTVLGSGQRPPPAREQYTTTPQRYPYGEDYQYPQSYQPIQNYASSQSYQSYPPAQQYPPPPNYRPPPPPPYQQQQPTTSFGAGMGGLASLASFFTGTQQYAPQFTNLLLGGNGGGGGLLHALTGTRPLGASGGGRPPNMQLIKALENIARNDDLECVPKVLCNMIASQTLRGQLPGFVTSPAITNFLAGFPAQSPALIYGRAALLGISGGERSCTQTYAKCPKNEYEILYYLNNHRGGFFKFFSESDEQKPSNTQHAQQSSSSSAGSTGGGTSFFSLLSALTGADPPVTTTTPRPTPPPTVASFDITQGIGNFFSNILSEYISGVEYQRRSSRAKRSITFKDVEKSEADKRFKFPKDTDMEDFHDEEDDEDTQDGIDFVDEQHTSESNEIAELNDTQGRVVFKSGEHDLHFFPAVDESGIDERLKDIYLQEVINKFNAAKSERKLKFPKETGTNGEGGETYDALEDVTDGEVVHFHEENESNPLASIKFHDNDKPSGAVHFGVEHSRPTRRGKAFVFQETQESTNYEPTREPREEYDTTYETNSGQRIIFPDHYEKHIRKGKILNRPTLYAATYDEYMGNAEADRLVLSDSHRPMHNHIDDSEDNNVNYEDKPLGPIYISQSSTQQHNTQSTNIQVYNDNRLHYNRGADTYRGDNGVVNRYRPTSTSTYSPSSSSNYNSNRYSSSSGSAASNYNRRPYYGASSSSSSASSGNRYDYPNANYVSNNRYGNRYQTTRSPRADDQNIYVTNSQGITTHYITPNGKKVYL